jgi:hypothetical protein
MAYFRRTIFALLATTLLLSNLGDLPGLATCTGADPCRACKNCKYCHHCAKDGGTCGVCKRR